MDKATDLTQALDLIRGLPGLNAIREPAWQQAVQNSMLMRMPAGCTFSVCSEDVDAVTVLLQGSIKVRAHSEDGREFSIYRIVPGEVCMLSIAFMHAKGRLHAEMSVERDTIVLQIPQEHFDRLMGQSPTFRSYLMRVMSGYVLKLLDLIEEVHFDDLQTRILNHITDLQRTSGVDVIDTTHQALANELGSSREVVSRILKNLERQGVLKLGRGNITVQKAPRCLGSGVEKPNRKSA